MPPDDITAPSLTQAIHLENDLIRRFRRWALRLLPFDQSLASLFDRLVMELVEHRRELLCHAGQTRAWTPRSRQAGGSHEPDCAEHFFILNREQAIATLGEALARMREAVRFYRLNAVLAPWGSLLGGLYLNLGAFKEPCIEMLQERLDWLRLQRLASACAIPCGAEPVWRH